MHLLVLDDEVQLGTFVADVATGAGWTAETAAHKADFRSQLFRRLPDAVSSISTWARPTASPKCAFWRNVNFGDRSAS